MSTETDSPFNVLRSLDTIQARQTIIEKNKKKAEQEGRRAQRRISRPEQFAVKTTPEFKALIEELAKIMNKSKVEVFETALLVLKEALDQQKSAKGKRK